MPPEPDDDRPWTEEQWEQLFRESDVRSAKFGEIFETVIDDPDRDAIIEREMGWDLDEPEPEGEQEDWVNPLSSGEEIEIDDEVDEEMRRSDEELERMPAYAKAFAFGMNVHDMLKPYLEAD